MLLFVRCVVRFSGRRRGNQQESAKEAQNAAAGPSTWGTERFSGWSRSCDKLSKNRLLEIQHGLPSYVEDLLTPTMGAANARLYSELLLGPVTSQTGRTDAEVAALGLAGTSLQVLTLALLQYPLHLYSVFALRVSNEHLLSGQSENAWGFGQIVALIMLAQTFIQCFRGVKGTLRKTPEVTSPNKGPEYREKKRIILAAESLTSIANQLKIPVKTEAPIHTNHPPAETRTAGVSSGCDMV